MTIFLKFFEFQPRSSSHENSEGKVFTSWMYELILTLFFDIFTAPGPVSNLAVRTTRYLETLQITWNNPTQPNGELSYFEINWREVYADGTEENPGKRITETAIGGRPEYSKIIQDLKNFTTYNVYVSAVNSLSGEQSMMNGTTLQSGK